MHARFDWLHPASLTQLRHMSKNLSHAIILSGEPGIGTANAAYVVAEHVQATVIDVYPERDEKIDVENGTISVAVIRRLYDQTKSIASSPRIIVIHQAKTMAIQAQHTFLKLLEEPTKNTHFILLSDDNSVFLPTILSRAQSVQLQKITQEATDALLDEYNVTDKTRRSQLSFIAAGLPEMIQHLTSDEDAFLKRSDIMRDARILIQGSAYERLKLASNYKDDRVRALTLLNDAMRFLRLSLSKQPEPSTIQRLQQLLVVQERVVANGNIRLQLATLMV